MPHFCRLFRGHRYILTGYLRIRSHIKLCKLFMKSSKTTKMHQETIGNMIVIKDWTVSQCQ